MSCKRKKESASQRVHVMPTGPGERPHEESLGCYCHPRRDESEPNLIIHNRIATA